MSLNRLSKIIAIFLLSTCPFYGFSQNGTIAGVILISDTMPAALVSIQVKEIKNLPLALLMADLN